MLQVLKISQELWGVRREGEVRCLVKSKNKEDAQKKAKRLADKGEQIILIEPQE